MICVSGACSRSVKRKRPTKSARQQLLVLCVGPGETCRKKSEPVTCVLPSKVNFRLFPPATSCVLKRNCPCPNAAAVMVRGNNERISLFISSRLGLSQPADDYVCGWETQ